MGGYIINFAVYTMAMIGLIFFALMVYKKCSGFGMITSSKNRQISIEETLALSPRKVLYLIRVENERFLIAGDIDKTSLIAKIGENENFPVNSKKVSQYADAEVSGIQHTGSGVVNKTANIDLSNLTPEQITNIRKNSGKLAGEKVSSVDDLPVIVDFPKSKSDSKDVLHSMLKKMNE